MSKSLIILGLIVVAIAVGAFFWFQNNAPQSALNPSPQTATENSAPLVAWIEIVKPKVFLVSVDGKQLKEFKTGDEIISGNILEIDKQGSAVVHFPDGSAARLDASTKLTINESQFDQQSEKLTVKMSLAVGRVWSKIIELATPDSLWEVKTANAVATVRGTAFGVSFSDGQSRVVVSEKKVRTNALDPKTGEEIKGAEKEVNENYFIAVKNEDIPKIQATRELAVLDIKTAPAEVKEWISENREKDAQLDRRIEELKQKGLEGRELREEFRQSIDKEDKNTPEDGQPRAVKNIEAEPKIETSEKKTDAKATAPLTSAKPQSVLVSTSRSLNKVVEGDRVNFSATLVMDDGSKVDISADSQWLVIGPIGKMVGVGVFEAELSTEVSELGMAPGRVAAVWKDSATGQEITGATEIFNVEAKVPELLEREE